LFPQLINFPQKRHFLPAGFAVIDFLPMYLLAASLFVGSVTILVSFSLGTACLSSSKR
jgi:hypothetical protein